MPGGKDGGKAAQADKRSEYREKGHPAVRPREAATLVIVRQDQQPRVLMGKRAASHQFMPNKFVFPFPSVADCITAPRDQNSLCIA